MRIRFGSLVIAAILFLPQLTAAGDISLAWDPNTQPELAGYKLCYGAASGQCGTQVDVGNTTAFTVSNLGAGTYYFSVKAYSSTGEESGYSNEVTATLAGDTDTQPPVISAVSSPFVSSNSATINWTTNEISDSQVEYGTKTGFGSSTAVNGTMVTAHSQILSGLAASTTYYYRVKSKDASANSAVSDMFSFMTAAPADTTPPVISDVSISGVTDSGATITWSTNEASDSQVEYGTSTSYGNSTALNTTRVTSHSQILSGLSADTTYHYRVKSNDAAGNAAVSADSTFKTNPSVLDITSGLVAAYAFDEGTGSASSDFSGKGNTAALYSTTWTTGKYGKALSFNGTSSYASAGAAGLPGIDQPKTISCWIYLVSKYTSVKTILSFGNPSLKAALQYGYKSLQSGTLGYNNKWIVVSKIPPFNEWHHYAYVYDGAQNRLYIDGVLASTSTIASPAATATEFRIARLVGGTQYFKGNIDDLRIYSRALTINEINLAMNTPIAASAPSPGFISSQNEEVSLTAAEPPLADEPDAQPKARPVVDIQLERKVYRQGETVRTSSFWISNPSDQGRDVELKTWLSLPGLQPIPLEDMGVDETLNLQPEYNRNYGAIPFLRISHDAPRATGKLGARLIDPVTGDILSENFSSFTIDAGRSVRAKAGNDLDAVNEENPRILLRSHAADSRPQYLLENLGAGPAEIELKVWIETSGGKPIPVVSVGNEGTLALPAGAMLTLDPLATMSLSPGIYVVRSRVLDSASGEMLCEDESEMVVHQP